MEGTVWVRDGEEGFVLARMGDLTEDGAEVLPLDAKAKKRTCSFDDIFPAGDHLKEFDDNCSLMYLNDATLLNNIRLRYRKNKIYVSTQSNINL